jgi:hypothetical protein
MVRSVRRATEPALKGADEGGIPSDSLHRPHLLQTSKHPLRYHPAV